MPDQPRTLADGLRRERERRNLTQQEVADLLGTSQQSYHRWETGSGQPRDREHFRRIAQHLGLSVLDVLTLAFVPEEDVPSHEIERRIRDVEARIATIGREERDGDGNAPASGETLATVTLARVRHIETMVEQIGGTNGRLTQLEDLVREVKSSQARLTALEAQLRELVELASRLTSEDRASDPRR
jgi:transcriptional regulator with XRE-family HTH domain